MRELLVTPSLFRIAKERQFKIEITDADDLIQIAEAYRKIIYCAVINAYEVRKFDNPDLVFDITLMDIEEWCMNNPEKYGQLIQDIVTLLTGKSVEELAEKKKSKGKSIWCKIMRK